MDLVKSITSEQIRTDLPQLFIGDTVKVHVKVTEGTRERIQVFEGTIISKKHGGIQETFTAKGNNNYFVGTVEGSPTLEDVIAGVKAGGYTKVVLQPLMVVAGDHANNDMAGDEEGSWKLAFEAEGIEAEVINIHTIKPIDEELIIKAAQKTKRIFTVEEHSVIGGLGSAVADILSENCPTKLTKIGIKDTYGHSGTAKALLHEYGLDAEGIANTVLAHL